MDNRSFRKVLVSGMALLKKFQRPSLWIYLTKLAHLTARRSISNHICKRILPIKEPEPEPEPEPDINIQDSGI